MKNKLTTASRESSTSFGSNSQPGSESGLRRFSNLCVEKFNKLRERITSELVARFNGTLGPDIIRQVVNEADALAAATGFPTLFLPALAEEKVLLASRHQIKQRLINERSWLRAA